MSRRIAMLAIFGIVSLLSRGSSPSAPLQTYSDSKYHVGDVWEYKTRQGEERSRFTVVRVEQSPKLGVIVRIGVNELAWQECGLQRVPKAIPHMPFARTAIDTSAVQVVAHHQVLPAYQEGYEDWRSAFLSGHAGVYTIPIKDAVALAEKTWRSGVGCASN